MLKIGDFAKLFDVSLKTIRFYEDKGLLKPALIDVYTGYRYFDEKNIREMTKVLILKELGLSLDEIKTFDLDKDLIDAKIASYKREIQRLESNMRSLSSLAQKEEVLKSMKPFINDEKAVGKWQLLGVSYSMENAEKEIYEEDDYSINELYLMPNGQEYWVIKWTRGFVYINRRECPYQIVDEKMYLKVVDDKSFYKVAVYEKIDDKEYTEEDIRIKDNIDVSFIKDEELIGFWQSVDFINSIDSFNHNGKKDNLFLNKIIVTPDDLCIVEFSSGYMRKTRYTKGKIIDLCSQDTICHYEYRKAQGEEYLIVEWKSGDYVYGKMINGYYVLKKLKS